MIGPPEKRTAVVQAILSRLVFRNILSSWRFEEEELRVITIGPIFEGLPPGHPHQRDRVYP